MKRTISNELLLCRYAGGVKLARPNQFRNLLSIPNIGDMFDSSLLLYFFDSNNVIQRINAATANYDGFDSESSAVGKTMEDVFIQDLARKINLNNHLIMQSCSMKIVEEHVVRKDGFDSLAISIKFPWYNDSNKISGVFGCSFIAESQFIVNALIQIVNFGLLNTAEISNTMPFASKASNNNVILSRRENETLSLLTKGFSAKNIGLKLGLSSRTVEHYIENIKGKMNAASKADLIIKAVEYFQ